MSHFQEPSDYKTEEFFLLRSFRENLVERMDVHKLNSLNALGEDFFFLVDQLSSFLFDKYQSSAALVELTQREFHWEVQIFVNQFLRQCAESTIQLLPFCQQLRANLDESAFSISFKELLDQAFLNHFYTSEVQNTLPA
jgi:hypothetical protein